MRVLFTTQPGSGMFNPLVPFARALVDAGHDVAFACADCFRPDVEAAGFAAFPAGLDWRNDQMTRCFPDAPPPGPARMLWITGSGATRPRGRWCPTCWRSPRGGGPISSCARGSSTGRAWPPSSSACPTPRPGRSGSARRPPSIAPLDALRRELGLAPDPTGTRALPLPRPRPDAALLGRPGRGAAADRALRPPAAARQRSGRRRPPGSAPCRRAGRWSTRRSARPR